MLLTNELDRAIILFSFPFDHTIRQHITYAENIFLTKKKMAIISSDDFNVQNEGVERQNRKKLPYKCKFKFGYFFSLFWSSYGSKDSNNNLTFNRT